MRDEAVQRGDQEQRAPRRVNRAFQFDAFRNLPVQNFGELQPAFIADGKLHRNHGRHTLP